MSELLQNLKKVGLQLMGGIIFSLAVYTLIWIILSFILLNGYGFFYLLILPNFLGSILRILLVFIFGWSYYHQNKIDLWKEFYGQQQINQREQVRQTNDESV